MGKKDNRFQRVLYEFSHGSFREIWKDRETGLLYLFHGNSSRGGVTPLLDQDGKPLIDKDSYKFCTKCGKQNSEGNKFCTECGNALA